MVILFIFLAKGLGKVLERSWKGLGKVLERSWKGLGKVLERSWKGLGKVFGGLMSIWTSPLDPGGNEIYCFYHTFLQDHYGLIKNREKM
jgi:hypothetical protein